MATFNFNLKIKVGKHTPLEVIAQSTAVNIKDIRMNEAPFKMTTEEMEILIEAAIEKSIGVWIDKKMGR